MTVYLSSGRRAAAGSLVGSQTAPVLIGAVLLRRESAVPPAFDPALRNPFPATPESLAMGERVYRTHCESCHGADGRGNGPAARTLSLRPVDSGIHAGMGHSDALLFYWVSYGVPGTAMPAPHNQVCA